jgi:hypothetical protein
MHPFVVLVLPRYLPLSDLDLQEAKAIDPQIIGDVCPLPLAASC